MFDNKRIEKLEKQIKKIEQRICQHNFLRYRAEIPFTDTFYYKTCSICGYDKRITKDEYYVYLEARRARDKKIDKIEKEFKDKIGCGE